MNDTPQTFLLRVCVVHQACEESKAKMGLAEVEEKPLTVPRPFNLTKPNPRKVPEPMKIEQVKPTRANDVPGVNWCVYCK